MVPVIVPLVTLLSEVVGAYTVDVEVEVKVERCKKEEQNGVAEAYVPKARFTILTISHSRLFNEPKRGEAGEDAGALIVKDGDKAKRAKREYVECIFEYNCFRTETRCASDYRTHRGCALIGGVKGLYIHHGTIFICDPLWSKRELLSIVSAQNVRVGETLQVGGGLILHKEEADKESYQDRMNSNLHNHTFQCFSPFLSSNTTWERTTWPGPTGSETSTIIVPLQAWHNEL